MNRVVSAPFGLSQRPAKMDWFDFIGGAIQACELSQKWNFQIPEEICVNPKEIGFLGNARGVNYKGKNIPVTSRKNCLPGHIQLFFDN